MKYKLPIFSVAIVLFIFVVVNKVHANPSQILDKPSAVSTSTITFMTPGTATTTQAFDTQAGGITPADSAALAVQFTASSTTSILGYRFEYTQGNPSNASIDCSSAVNQSNCDWYSDNLGFTITNASTTQSIVSTVPNTYTWTFSSSTSMCDSSTNLALNNRGCKIVSVPTPTRYVRVVFFLASSTLGGTNGAVWSDWIPKRQNR